MMDESERCDTCDGWGWIKDRENPYGPEIACPQCVREGRIAPLMERSGE